EILCILHRRRVRLDRSRVWQSIGSADRYDDPLTRPVLVARGVIYRECVNVCAEHIVNKLGVRVKPFGLVVEVFVVVLKVMDVIGLYVGNCVSRPRIAQQIIEVGTPRPIRTHLIKRHPSIEIMQHLQRCWIIRVWCGARNWPAWCGARRTRRWWHSAVPIAAVVSLKIVIEYLVE